MATIRIPDKYIAILARAKDTPVLHLSLHPGGLHWEGLETTGQMFGF